jgi:uncharacterized protein (UPF0264 family)
MPRALITRTHEDVEEIRRRGDHTDSRRAAWFAIGKGSEVIADVQRLAATRRWTSLRQTMSFLNDEARQILLMRSEAIAKFKQAPHHRLGFRLSRLAGAAHPRPVDALCLISGHEGQEIPGLVRNDRVVVDVEHMEQALGPATVDEIFKIRLAVGEQVYISTNVSESPQIVRDMRTGRIDTRSTAALTATKVIGAIQAGADVVKVGFAHLDEYKRDLRSPEVLSQMRTIRRQIDAAVESNAITMPLNKTTRYPLVAVFFPELGINAHGERPIEIAAEAIRLAGEAGWQGVLIDTFEKHTGKRYQDFYSLAETTTLSSRAHEAGLEFWAAGSISLAEIEPLVKTKVDLICFGGAARHPSGRRTAIVQGRPDETIKRPLVEQLVKSFERADPRPAAAGGRAPTSGKS